MQSSEATTAPQVAEACDMFASYAHADSSVVRPLLGALKDVGIKVLDAADGQPSMWGQDLEAYLQGVFPGSARSAMLFFSENYSKSDYCARELAVIVSRAAEQPGDSLILPVRLDDSPVPAPIERLVSLDPRGVSVREFSDKARQALDHWDEARRGNPDTLSDESLVEQVRLNRDKRAFTVLYERCYPVILRLLRMRSLDQQDIEEVANLTMLRVWERIDRFDPQSGSFRAWLFATARHTMIDLLRKRYRHAERTSVPPSVELPKASELERQELHESILRAINALSRPERDIITMLLMEEMSTKEIADKLGLTQYTVRARYHRALQRVRNLLVHASND